MRKKIFNHILASIMDIILEAREIKKVNRLQGHIFLDLVLLIKLKIVKILKY